MRQSINIVIAIMALIMINANAYASENVNYFGQAGTKWDIATSSMSSPENDFEIEELMAYEGGLEEGNKVMYLADPDCPNFTKCTPLLVVDQRVYYRMPDPEQSWKLLYDFSLEAGEGATCWDFLRPVSYYIVCVDRRQDELNPSLTEMSLNIYQNEEDYRKGKSPICDNPYARWIAGLGSIAGPLDPLHAMKYGYGSILLEVTQGDNAIYRSKYYTDVEEIADTTPSVRIGNGEIAVERAPSSMLYDLDGRSYSAANGRFSNLAKGVYILRCGDKTRKIFVP